MPKSWLPWSQSSQVRLLVVVIANVADAAVGGIVAAVALNDMTPTELRLRTESLGLLN